MLIAVLGTGVAGRALSTRLAELGHTVTMGTRDPDETRMRPDYVEISGVQLAGFAEAAADADVVVVATNGTATLEVLRAIGEDRLAGMVVMDVSNPLDFSAGFPPTLSVKDTDSLAERLQRANPTAQVVKALNTVNCSLMVTPQHLADGDHTIFIAGDDAAARAHVKSVLQDLDWVDIVEFPALEAARGLEMYLPLWVRLMQQLGTPQFNVKLVR